MSGYTNINNGAYGSAPAGFPGAGGGAGGGNQFPQQQFNGGAAGQQFMNNIPNVSPEMLNMGLSAGQDMINKQREKWMPGMSSLWIDMKSYFAVSIHPFINVIFDKYMLKQFVLKRMYL